MPYHYANEEEENTSWADRLRHMLCEYLDSSRLWPVGTLCAGPYSPFALEKRYPGQWREAFEDLLCTEAYGTPLRDPSIRVDWMPRGDWLEFLASNDLLEGWRFSRDASVLRFFDLRSPGHGLTVTTDELTRHFDFGRPCEVTGAWSCPQTPKLLDAYVGVHNSISQPVVSPPIATDEAKNVSPAPGSLISELTTTERTTMPDGAVVEKRVLRKRFTDGREEELEVVEKLWDTIPKSSSAATTDGQALSRSMPSPGTTEETHRCENGKGPKGWFWS